jgi:hypothetical protein
MIFKTVKKNLEILFFKNLNNYCTWLYHLKNNFKSFQKWKNSEITCYNVLEYFISLYEKLSFVTWFMTKLSVMENIHDYMTM